MGYSVLKIHNKFNASNHLEFIMDYDDDINWLPGVETCSPGSTAYSIESGKSWIIGHDGIWALKKNTGGGGNPPVFTDLYVDENGDYYPGDYSADGFDAVSVNVPELHLTSLSVTENGDYNTHDYDADGFYEVHVDVQDHQLASLFVSENGDYYPGDYGANGFDAVSVNVEGMSAHSWIGLSLSEMNDEDIYTVIAEIGTALGTITFTMTVGEDENRATAPISAFLNNGVLVLTGGASDGTIAAAAIFVGTGGGGFTTQQYYFIQSGVLTDLTAYGDQIISNVVITLYY